MEEVRRKRRPIVVTKRGKPVVKLVPADDPGEGIFGVMRGKIQVRGNIVAPVFAAEDWTALR
jgi:antitoxin (DNA-binding transcriptional repressor) of toxin-antitoxin stability system